MIDNWRQYETALRILSRLKAFYHHAEFKEEMDAIEADILEWEDKVKADSPPDGLHALEGI